MWIFKASGGKLGCENTQRQTQDAQQICGNLGIGIEDAPPEAYEVLMRSTKSTRKMFSVACGTTHPATQTQPNQEERENAEIRHRAHIVAMCSVNRKTLVSSKVLVGLAHHPSSHSNHTPPTAQPTRKRERVARIPYSAHMVVMCSVNRQTWYLPNCWPVQVQTPKSKLQTAHAAKAEQ